MPEIKMIDQSRKVNMLAISLYSITTYSKVLPFSLSYSLLTCDILIISTFQLVMKRRSDCLHNCLRLLVMGVNRVLLHFLQVRQPVGPLFLGQVKIT